MMNYLTNQMLRLFAEDAGSPELRTPELGRFGSKYKRTTRRVERSMISPVVFAGMSYRELIQM